MIGRISEVVVLALSVIVVNTAACSTRTGSQSVVRPSSPEAVARLLAEAFGIGRQEDSRAPPNSSIRPNASIEARAKTTELLSSVDEHGEHLEKLGTQKNFTLDGSNLRRFEGTLSRGERHSGRLFLAGSPCSIPNARYRGLLSGERAIRRSRFCVSQTTVHRS